MVGTLEGTPPLPWYAHFKAGKYGKDEGMTLPTLGYKKDWPSSSDKGLQLGRRQVVSQFYSLVALPVPLMPLDPDGYLKSRCFQDLFRGREFKIPMTVSS